MEPTKRRRWNSAKGEGDCRRLGKELQEPVPFSNAPVPSAKVQTPKSAPPEKVAVTRIAPTRAEAAVNGESQQTRVGKLHPVLCVGACFVYSLHPCMTLVMELLFSFTLLGHGYSAD